MVVYAIDERKGGRTEDTIVSYMRKATGPSAKKLKTDDEVKEFAAANKVHTFC